MKDVRVLLKLIIYFVSLTSREILTCPPSF